jgi:hypothetical protein
MESSTGGSANKLTNPRYLIRSRIASILAPLVYMELVTTKDRTVTARPFAVCILRMPFSFGLMRVGSAGLEYLPF